MNVVTDTSETFFKYVPEKFALQKIIKNDKIFFVELKNILK